ncbi:MAG: hypothetical protein HZA92_16465 [Verrucomicrobia bacterium]|nr:hypothetical protein [Verrucomicrobiota bacterium]
MKRIFLLSLAVFVSGTAPLWAGDDSRAPLQPVFQPKGKNVWDFWFIRQDDLYHAFYLEYPDKEVQPDQSQRHSRQWVGHAVSKDLLHWDERATALSEAPQRGIATGNCVRDGDKWFMLLTYQGFTLAESNDLDHWKWKGKAEFPARMEADWLGKPLAFRPGADPYIYPEKIGGWWYATFNSGIAGAPANKAGAQVMMRSRDLVKWEPHKVLAYPERFERTETAQFWEHSGRWYLQFGGVAGDKQPLDTYIYIAERFDGPYKEESWSRVKLPGIRHFYLGKRLVAVNGGDVFVVCQNFAALSQPFRMTYGVDGAVSFSIPPVGLK